MYMYTDIHVLKLVFYRCWVTLTFPEVKGKPRNLLSTSNDYNILLLTVSNAADSGIRVIPLTTYYTEICRNKSSNLLPFLVQEPKENLVLKQKNRQFIWNATDHKLTYLTSECRWLRWWDTSMWWGNIAGTISPSNHSYPKVCPLTE